MSALLVSRLRTYGELVSFSHTVFAMPFAASAAALALTREHTPLTPLRAVIMILCMVFARTAAMAFNRFADRSFDAENPRTRARHIPSGRVTPREALGLALLSGALFLLLAGALGPWPMRLAPVVLLVLFGYSYAKRFTWAVHLWLGVALALAPGGVWIAMGLPPHAGIFFLMAAVVFWLFGLDILYALQDEAFDRARGLFSIPARFGTRAALWIARGAHLFTVALLTGMHITLGRGVFLAIGIGAVAALLLYEHWLVRGGDLSKIDKAFFDTNAKVSLLFFALTLADVLMQRWAPHWL